MITIETLKDLGACEEGVNAFEEAFPNGAESWEEVVRVGLDTHPDDTEVHGYIGWLASHEDVDISPQWRMELLSKYNSERGIWGHYAALDVKDLSFEDRCQLIERYYEPMLSRYYCVTSSNHFSLDERLKLIEELDTHCLKELVVYNWEQNNLPELTQHERDSITTRAKELLTI